MLIVWRFGQCKTLVVGHIGRVAIGATLLICRIHTDFQSCAPVIQGQRLIVGTVLLSLDGCIAIPLERVQPYAPGIVVAKTTPEIKMPAQLGIGDIAAGKAC